MKKKLLLKKSEIKFYMFIMPFIIGFSLFTVFPILMSFIFSLNKMSILDYALGVWEPVGFSNYKEILQDEKFYIAIKNTFIFAFLKVFFTLFISLMLALLLNKKIPGRKLFRTLVYIPAVLPIVGSAVLWKLLFSGDASILSWLFSFVGIDIPPETWLGKNGLYSAVILSVTMSIGSTMIILLAGLQGIPESVEEAARLDGVNPFINLIYIILPYLSSILFFVSITNFIGSLQVYAEIDLLIGQLTESSMTISMLAMNYYKDPRIGLSYSSAISWLIFVVVTIFTVIYFKLSSKNIFFAGD